MNRDELCTATEAAVDVARAAGAIALRSFRLPIEVFDKSNGGAFDPVTRVDREVERFIRGALGERFPGDAIVGEEEPGEPSDGRWWLVDPIDGTRAFVTGMPEWGVLIGLMEGEDPVAGVAHLPLLGETFFGAAGESWLEAAGGRTRLRTRRTTRLSEAVLQTTDPTRFRSPTARRAFARIAAACRMTRFGGDCYAYCLLALGLIDLVIEDGLERFDVLPLAPIVEGAGGRISGDSGGALGGGGPVIAAGDRELHRRAVELWSPGQD